MVKKRKTRKNKEKEYTPGGMILVIISVLIFISLMTFSASDPPASATGAGIVNFLGLFGAYVSYYVILIFGNFSFPLVLSLSMCGINGYLPEESRLTRIRIINIMISLFFLSMLLQAKGITLGNKYDWGGAVLIWIWGKLSMLLGEPGLYIIIALSALYSFVIIFGKSPLNTMKSIIRSAGKIVPAKKRHVKKMKKISGPVSKEGHGSADELTYDIEYFSTADSPVSVSDDDEGTGELILKGDMVIGEKMVEGTEPIPPLEILRYIEKSSEREDVETMSELLEDSLAEYDIKGNVINVEIGPMASMYEVDVKKGTKVSKIISVDKDLSLMMKKSNIRIIAPLPGRGTVGFEIPNDNRTFVSLRELVETEEFRKSRSPLTVGFGSGMDGRPVIINIEELPHLLIAGATMSGKSIGIHTIIMSLLYKATYEDVRLILIDPKRLEFPYYNGIPHLLTDVIVEPKEAAAVLKWAIYEMDRRYKLLAHHGHRNIQSFNDHNKEEKMPYLAIVIDELADLLVTAGQDVEFAIIRLAQKARAVGIHLVLATQRPSSDVITGTIKANFPSRVAYKTATKINSRIILDGPGAETLLGKGDFLYLDISGEIKRGQGALVTVPEITKTVQYLKNLEKGADNFKKVFEKDKEISLQVENKDDLYPEVLQIIYNKLLTQDFTISTSALQRKLSIGYNRAAKIIDSLADDGLIDREGGSKGRNILVDIGTLKDYI